MSPSSARSNHNTNPSCRILRGITPKKVSRALAIKSQYLSQTALDLESKRKQVVQDVGSGILGLGLLRSENESKGGS